MNDNPPKFEQSSYSCVLSGRAVRGQYVTVVSASDPDYVDHNNLLYAIADGNEMQTYSIEPMTGIITLMNMQNFANKQSSILNISVTDGVYTSFTRVKINILPTNLYNPTFPHLLYDVKINENQLAGRLVITVSARKHLMILIFSSFLRRERKKAKKENCFYFLLHYFKLVSINFFLFFLAGKCYR